jgi:hypothetical protein
MYCGVLDGTRVGGRTATRAEATAAAAAPLLLSLSRFACTL